MSTGGKKGSGAPPSADRADKLCARCGRTMQWRAKWRANWAEVKYCSDACRAKPDPMAEQLEAAILAGVTRRGRNATICPSEATRVVFGAPENWPKDGMERTRQAARRLIARGEVEMLQRRQVVDPSRARGPVRLRVAAPVSVAPVVARGRRTKRP